MANTLTSLNRWSIADKQLPGNIQLIHDYLQKLTFTAVNSIKAIHVYDFDNTRQYAVPVSWYTTKFYF
jgi:hypothetical protein